MSDYDAYLRSSGWKARAGLLKTWAAGCEFCGIDGPLHVHHIRYIRVGYELPSDLAVLCEECHEHVHSTEHEEETTACGLTHHELGELADEHPDSWEDIRELLANPATSEEPS